MLQGSMVALVTPMKEDQSIDLEALSALTEWHIASGTNALVILGTTGEAPTITFEERKVIISQVVREVNGRIPVVVGTGSNSTAVALTLTEQANELGADACLIVTPYYNRPTQEGLYQHYRFLAEKVAIPQIVYNVPTRTGCNIGPKTLAQLAALPNVLGIKESVGTLERLKDIQDYCGGFNIFSGDDATAESFMLGGAEGVISVAANIFPVQVHELCEAALSGDKQRADVIDAQLKLVYKALQVEANPIPVKWALYYLEKIGLGIRLPLTWLSCEHEESVRKAMQSMEKSFENAIQ